jgi:hypothetical protein
VGPELNAWVCTAANATPAGRASIGHGDYLNVDPLLGLPERQNCMFIVVGSSL